MSEEELIKIFSTGEKVEKTLRGTKPPSNTNTTIIDTTLNTNSGKNKNKNKKKGK